MLTPPTAEIIGRALIDLAIQVSARQLDGGDIAARVEALRDLPVDLIKRACLEIGRTQEGRGMPTVQRIRAMALQLRETAARSDGKSRRRLSAGYQWRSQGLSDETDWSGVLSGGGWEERLPDGLRRLLTPDLTEVAREHRNLLGWPVWVPPHRRPEEHPNWNRGPASNPGLRYEDRARGRSWSPRELHCAAEGGDQDDGHQEHGQ